MDIIKKLSSIFSKKDKKIILLLFLLSIFISFIEMIGIGIIMPFISVAVDFHKIFENRYLNTIYNFFNFDSPMNFVVSFGIALIFFYIFRGFLNYLYVFLLSKFTQTRYYVIAYKLFENYMGFNYKDFINRNSSDLFKNINNEALNLVGLINAVLFMSSEFFVLIFIYSFLLYMNWKMTILITLFLGLNIFILKLLIKKQIIKAGINREKFQKRFYRIMNSAFGNFKMVKLKGIEDEVVEEFKKATYGYALSNVKSQSFTHLPRIYLEAVAFSLIAIIVVFLILYYHHDIKNTLSILMAFVLGLYRILPSVNRIITSYNQILFYKNSLDIIHNDLIYETENLKEEPINFNKNIKVKDLYFEFKKNKPVLKNINLKISKGEKVGIVGESGSGKSTLIDIIIGLYKPKKGQVLIDDVELNENNIKSWRRKIGYIPQMIYLFDGTVAENVAFGHKIDEKKIKEVLKKANILDFLEKHHEGIHTMVGEGGVKLSGGQKQRIAIARALYTDPEVLVLDEATSALDIETESKIMDEIYEVGSNKTMIIIAHRVSTLDRCDRIIRLENGEIKNG